MTEHTPAKTGWPQRASRSGAPRPPPNNLMHPGDVAPPGTPATGENICPQCRGIGKLGATACPNCGGTGKVIEGISGG